MTPVQFCIARAAAQLEDPKLLEYARSFDQQRPAIAPLQSVRSIVRETAGETVHAPRKPKGTHGKQLFTLAEYRKRYGTVEIYPPAAAPLPETPAVLARRGQIEREWEEREIAIAEAEARKRRR